MLCLQCSNLSISRLVELARVELSAHSFPQKSFYTHHGSFPALVVSANNGCGFCQYIYQGLKDPPSQSTESYRERQSEIEAVEAEGGPTDIKIAINTKHLYSTSTSCQAKDVELFDTLMVQVGLIDNFELREDGEKEPIPTLEFVIHTPEGVQAYNGCNITDAAQKSPSSWMNSRLGDLLRIPILRHGPTCILR